MNSRQRPHQPRLCPTAISLAVLSVIVSAQAQTAAPAAETIVMSHSPDVIARYIRAADGTVIAEILIHEG